MIVDKPGKARDFYHSCYALSGLSIAQHSYLFTSSSIESTDAESGVIHAYVYGDVNNHVIPTSAIYNISLKKLEKVLAYFSSHPPSHNDLINNEN